MLLHLYTKLCRVLLFLVLVVVECEFNILYKLKKKCWILKLNQTFISIFNLIMISSLIRIHPYLCVIISCFYILDIHTSICFILIWFVSHFDTP